MQGSCRPPSQNQVWSLFALRVQIPQAINDWVPAGPKSAAPPLLCPADLNLGDQLANCFSFACDLAGSIKSVPVATCHCALGESPEGKAVLADTTFLTQAGQRDTAICSQHPVAGVQERHRPPRPGRYWRARPPPIPRAELYQHFPHESCQLDPDG